MTAAVASSWKNTLHMYGLWPVLKNVVKKCSSSFPDAQEREEMLQLQANGRAVHRHSGPRRVDQGLEFCVRYGLIDPFVFLLAKHSPCPPTCVPLRSFVLVYFSKIGSFTACE